jgi:hypothetical protein
MISQSFNVPLYVEFGPQSLKWRKLYVRGQPAGPSAIWPGLYGPCSLAKLQNPSYLDLFRAQGPKNNKNRALRTSHEGLGYNDFPRAINPNKTGFAVFLLARTYMDLEN